MRTSLSVLASLPSFSLMPRDTIQRRIPNGLRLYAFGDVHGRADLLTDLLDEIEQEASVAAAQTDRQTQVIGLGDYIDRGPDSRQVIEILISLSSSSLIDFTALRGNHEETLLNGLQDPSALSIWLQHGGDAALRSYGIEPPENPGKVSGKHLHQIAVHLKRAIPVDHMAFLKTTWSCLQVGDYFFTHAGVRPGQALHKQDNSDLLWIRNEFLTSGQDFGAVIVHGHTVVDDPDVRRNRIGLDTGAYKTNVLTCLVLEAEQAWLIQMTPDGLVQRALWGE